MKQMKLNEVERIVIKLLAFISCLAFTWLAQQSLLAFLFPPIFHQNSSIENISEIVSNWPD